MQVWSTIKTISANKKAFTLIELLGVIVVLGILAVLGTVSVLNLVNKAKEKVFTSEAVAFINAARTKSAETIVPDEGLCYSIEDLAPYVEKDLTGYSGSVYVSGDNDYTIWISKDPYIITKGIIGNMDAVLVNGEIEASSICPSSFILVVVNTNSGVWNGDLPNVGYEGQQIDLTNVAAPVKTGYTFSGWSVSGTGSTLVNNLLTIGSDTVVLTANWTANSYTLTVNANGGTWSGTSPQNVAVATNVTINNPIKANFAFTGWTVSGTGSTMVGTTFTMGSANTTITANWLLTGYTLTVDSNSGTWSGTSPQTLLTGVTATINYPSRLGYVFSGWTVSGTGSTVVGTTFTMGSANTTITANWLTYATMYTYTGSSTVIDDGSGNWRIKFLTSGTFTPLANISIDVFLLGGGGGGSGAEPNQYEGSGGGAGYTATYSSYTLNANQAYSIVVGGGGGGGAQGINGGAGGSTTGFTYSIAGGTPGLAAGKSGGYGGSGGGGGAANGGTNGGNGGQMTAAYYIGGGQGWTTKEFADAAGTLYSGGGGGSNAGGGAGGGGNGANAASWATSGGTNTGGGGGGGSAQPNHSRAGASGGSGILVIRNHR